ncbi:hypothetical protein GOP56_00210 [Brevibacillus sp. 7WMA2]|uniref:Uncharacterized protein n=1 Tax=Brevibacillus laterosporus LMG 15441 TaxID=1042163 RepID=A0A075R2Z8_BRELA|nr:MULTISPECIES: hypothetical protein [Brevibacillus]AIG25786.1 hypothetical protein BRLA_c014570 [Brevibacillus laterosporus LMG 15441]AUM64399.1 hypothetical protein C0R09_07570 [Brevibacillus laterosporus]AYK07311.1 hypothetical protein D8Z77_13550 [Brevibacillus laterosporus]ERM18425.1 hypothetical protein P615_15370 [Brevibacillus laterosporus PE36]MBA4533381.1 hypothetical protein [Brevibacillus halotolerans]
MDQLITFAKDYWVILILVLLAVFVLNFFLKALYKIVLFSLVVGAILVFGFNYTPTEVVNIGRQVVNGVDEVFTSTVRPLIDSEIKDATYNFREDGSYEIKTTNIRIEGKKGDPKATVYYKNFNFSINIKDLGELAQQHIQKAADGKSTP